MIQSLLEHFNTGANGFLRISQTEQLNLVTNLENTLLDTTGHNGTATFDRENVFDRHEHRLVNFTSWLRNVFVESFHQLGDASAVLLVGWVIQSTLGVTTNDANVIAWELVLIQQIANFHLDELEKLFVVDKIALIEEADQSWNVHLLGQQNVFASLWHRTVSSRDDQNRAVHLSRTSDHFLNIICVPRAIDVSVVTIWGFVLNVANRDRDGLRVVTNGTTLGNVRIALELRQTLCSLNGENGGRRCCLAVIDVANRANVHVWLRALKIFLRHFARSPLSLSVPPHPFRASGHSTRTQPRRQWRRP